MNFEYIKEWGYNNINPDVATVALIIIAGVSVLSVIMPGNNAGRFRFIGTITSAIILTLLAINISISLEWTDAYYTYKTRHDFDIVLLNGLYYTIGVNDNGAVELKRWETTDKYKERYKTVYRVMDADALIEYIINTKR